MSKHLAALAVNDRKMKNVAGYLQQNKMCIPT
jgi:hypothetical protein